MQSIERVHSKKKFKNYVLGADIGGTNTNIGFFGIGRGITLLRSYHYKTCELNDLHEAVNDAMNKFGHGVSASCFAVAGPVPPTRDKTQMTNADLVVDTRKILKNTKLKSTFLINDFEAIGYAINIEKDIVKINNKKAIPKAQKAILGAGTDLGKAILYYDRRIKAYTPIASEGAHSDFPVNNKEELELIEFIKKKNKVKSVRNGMVISGRGIENIYSYLRPYYNTNEIIKEIDRYRKKAELISKYRKKDKLCKEVFRMFSRFYGRAAKNFGVEALALGGVYIAGGIAAKNEDILGKEFLKEFENIRGLKGYDVPVYLIKNYDAGMKGAGFAAWKRKDFEIK